MNDLQLKIEKSLVEYQSISSRLIMDEDQNSILMDLGKELSSDLSLDSIKLDPYWPKWNSPWWKALLLYEAGYKHLIPHEFLDNLINIIDSHYLHYFPLIQADLPENCDPYRHVICFCALGNMYKILEDCGYDVHMRLPWWYEWLEKYQLPDGGYNCDEAVYTKNMKGSFLSTLPMLEAMLIVFQKTKDSHIKALLDKGAQYLLQRGLYKTSTLQDINKGWLQLSFPRYYDYDILRGITFIIDWAYHTGSELPGDIIRDCFDQIAKLVNEDGYLVPAINKISSEGSLFYVNQQSPVAPPLDGCIVAPGLTGCHVEVSLLAVNKQWIWKDQSDSFPALDLFNLPGEISIPLTLEWYRTLEKLIKVKLD